MKKKLLIIMLALIMTIASAFALTACGETNGDGNGGSNTGNNGNGDNTDKTTVVTPGGDNTVTTPETPDSGDNDNQGGSGNPGGGNKDTDDNDNHEKPATEGLKYTLLADDTYEVTGYDGTATEINIPSTYNGKPVTSIGDMAFYTCTSLTSIEIPSSVTNIGVGAFVSCSSLTSITIPNSVTSIGDYAFYDCYRLVEVYNLSSLNITKGSSDNGAVGYYALDIYTDKNAPSKLTKENDFVIHTEGNVKTLVGYFGDRTSITIPSSVTSIGDSAFSNCTSLTSITIPSSVTSIGDDAFSDCYRLVEVYNLSSLSITKGSEDNGAVGLNALDIYTDKNAPSKLTKENDFVIHTEGNVKTLVGYFGDRTSITIPDSVTSIGDNAFYGCSSLTSITIPDSVTSIRDDAFSGCSSLTSVTIPSSVTSIGWGAFYDCSSLKTINCEASSKPSGWESGWKSGCNATVTWGYTGK